MRFCTACGHSWDGHARAVPGCIVEDCSCTEYGHTFAGPEVECTCGYFRRGHAISHDEGCPLWVDQYRAGNDLRTFLNAFDAAVAAFNENQIDIFPDEAREKWEAAEAAREAMRKGRTENA